MMRRNKQKSDFTQYIVFLKSVMKKIEKVCIIYLVNFYCLITTIQNLFHLIFVYKLGLENAESLKLIEQHITRINTIYRTALKYFKDDVSLWKDYIKFLVKAVRIFTFCNLC